MMNSKKIVLCAAGALAVLLTGCQQLQIITRAKPEGISPFIEHSELLVRQKATFPFHYFYLDRNAGKYDNICVAPVNTKYLRQNRNWAMLDQKMAEQLGSDINKLALFTQKTFIEAIKSAPGTKKLSVIDTPVSNGRTLLMRLAIVTIIPTKAELNVIGTAANFILPGIGIITGQVAAGSVTMECVVEDAKTGKIIAMFANTEKDQKAILNFAGMTWYTSAERNIQKQAESTAKVFSGADYSYTYRRLIKIISL